MALIAFDRFYRDRWLKGQWLAPFYLILSLMAGEAGLAFFAFIFSYVLFIHRGGVWNKMTLLIPYTLLFFSWAALYWINDLGTQGSGMYINPIGEPLSFLFLMIQRLPILLFGLFGFLASDLWLLYPPGIDTLVLSIALIFLLAFFILLSPGLKRNRLLRFWLLATVLALLPLSATFPSDRNLIIPGIAGMAILAHLIRLHVRRFQYRKWVGRAGTTSGKKIRRFSTNLLLIVLFISHLIAAPIQRPIRANTFRTMMRFIERSDSFIPSTPEIKRKTVILLNYPFDLLILYLPIFRSFYGIPGPEKILLLKSGIDEILVNRISKNTLRIRVPGGYLSHRMDLLFRSPDERMEVGDRIQLKEMAIKVVEVNSRGMPMELELVFSGSPEDSDFLWLCCRKNLDLSPFSIPAVGKNVRIKTEIDLPAGFRHLFQ